MIPPKPDPNGGTPKRLKKIRAVSAVIPGTGTKKGNLKAFHYDNALRSLFIVQELDKKSKELAKMSEKRTRNWATIIYPKQKEDEETTTPDNWADILAELGLKCAVSPLHDKDVTGDGQKKKAHRHVLIAFDGVKTRKQAEEVFSRIGGVGAEPVNSLYGMTRYLTHEDNPEKAHYSTVDVLTFGGFEYKRYASTKEDEEKQVISQMGEIFKSIDEYGLYSFSDLADFLLQEKPELFGCYRKNAYFFANYLKSKQNIYKNTLDSMEK